MKRYPLDTSVLLDLFRDPRGFAASPLPVFTPADLVALRSAPPTP